MSGLYSTYRWQKARKRFLRTHPICVLCEQISITTVADVVDHVVPHKGDMTLFWSEANWQPACKRCHDSRKRVLERGDKMMPHASWNTSGGRSTSGELKPRKPVRISSQ